MSSFNDHPRWFSLSDGTLTVKASIYDALNFSQTYEALGGSSVQRMMSGAGVKQTNWSKLKTVLSGSGGIPLGLTDLDYSQPLLLKCGAPRAITRPTNSFPQIPPHRVDANYEPYVLKLVQGAWVPHRGVDDGTSYTLLYYPQIYCFADAPNDGYAWDESRPSTWTLTAEEI